MDFIWDDFLIVIKIIERRNFGILLFWLLILIIIIVVFCVVGVLRVIILVRNVMVLCLFCEVNFFRLNNFDVDIIFVVELIMKVL